MNEVIDIVELASEPHALYGDLDKKVKLSVDAIYQQIKQSKSILIAFSAGKDSNVLLLLAYLAIKKANANGLDHGPHFVVTSDSTVENPEVIEQAARIHAAIDMLPDDFKIKAKMVKPGVIYSFQSQVIGRGKLPQFPGQTHDCAVDYKIVPQERFVRKLKEKYPEKQFVSLVGSRFSESEERRANMLKQGYTIDKPVTNDAGFMALAPICDFELDDVWGVISQGGENGRYQGFVPDYQWLIDFYRDANNDTCVVTLGEHGNRSSCGSRSGCVTCQVSGDKDKSLESLISKPQYHYLKNANEFRNYITNTRFDWSKRKWIGRTKNKWTGMVRLQPHVYSFQMRMKLLAMMITIDAKEQDRAALVAEDLHFGKLEKSPFNLKMSTPQFQFIDEKQLIMIDFYWSLYNESPRAFKAIEIWHDIYHNKRYVDVPDIPKIPQTAVPTARYVDLAQWPDADHHAFGLYDPAYDTASLNLDATEGSRLHRKTNGSFKTTPYDVADSVDVDPLLAIDLVEEFYPENQVTLSPYTVNDALLFYLQKGIVKLSPRVAASYHNIAQHGQLFQRINRLLNAPDLPQKLYQDFSISHAAHEKCSTSPPPVLATTKSPLAKSDHPNQKTLGF